MLVDMKGMLAMLKNMGANAVRPETKGMEQEEFKK